MKSLLFFVSLCVFITIAAPLHAQDSVPLRTGVHDGYARLVFGWSEGVDYTLKQSDKGRVTLTFNNAAVLDQSDANFSEIKTVGTFDVQSQNPLTVALSIPKSSKIRHFKIGKRVIVDIYDPDNPKDLEGLKPRAVTLSPVPSTPAKKEALVKVEPKPAPIKQAAPEHAEIKTETKPEAKAKPPVKVATVPKTPPAVPPAFVLVPETLPLTTVPDANHKKTTTQRDAHDDDNAKKQAIKKAIDQTEHIISLRGMQSMSMAAYESFGTLWMVVKGGNSFSQPGLTSPTPDIFPGIQTVQNDIVDVYRVDLPQQPLIIKGIGGALAWDIVMGDKVKAGKAVQPKRLISSIDGLRGGSVLWPLENVDGIVEVVEPVTGETLIVVTVESATQLAGAERHFIDFDVLHSPIGLVIRPKVDDLDVRKVDEGIEISRPSGLVISLPQDLEAARLFSDQSAHSSSESAKNLLFKFDEWQLGDHHSLKDRENILLAGLHGQAEARRVQDLLKLGKMFLAHNRGPEALGYFDFAQSELPALEDSAEFRAYRGAAKAMSWKSEAALDDFLFSALDNNDEINLWKSYVLADLGDWQQASDILPPNYSALYTYPYNIASRLAVVLAEVNLRAGKVKQAEELMTYVDTKKEHALSDSMKAALAYLRGEAFRQKKDVEQTETIWTDLTQNQDDLYRTKAGLALTILLANDHKIDNDETINRLERLRYAWRGDGLEAQVNYWLGDAYFKDKNYVKGLTIMRQAASIAKETVLATRITSEMARTFKEMFEEKNLKDVSALDAVSVFDQFKELTPVGTQGDKLVQRLAEHLVRSDLLGRASDLLQHQVDHRLKGKEKLRIAIRLAAIELLDKNPQNALNALGKANDTLKVISDSPEKEKSKHEIDLLRIRAYSQNKEYNKALSLIDNMPFDRMVNRLKADIAWQAGYWDVAAAALHDVIMDENISMTEKLSKEQVDIILNRSIALNLDNDRIALANMREKYSALMLESNKDKARQFEVITRPRRTATLDDREALMSAVAEVDLFKDFLESYRNLQN